MNFTLFFIVVCSCITLIPQFQNIVPTVVSVLFRTQSVDGRTHRVPSESVNATMVIFFLQLLKTNASKVISV